MEKGKNTQQDSKEGIRLKPGVLISVKVPSLRRAEIGSRKVVGVAPCLQRSSVQHLNLNHLPRQGDSHYCGVGTSTLREGGEGGEGGGW